MKVRFRPEKRINKDVCKCPPGTKDDEHKSNCHFKEGILFMFVRTGKSTGGRNTIKISTGYKILLKNWNEKERELRNGTPNIIDINKKMAKMESKANGVYSELDEKYKPIPFDILKNAIEARIKNTVEDTQKDFFTVLDELIAGKKKANRSPLTVKKYETLKEHLIKFKEKNKRISISFEEINDVWLEKLKDFFIETLEHANSSVEKYFRVLKTLLKWAVEKGHTQNKTFEHFDLDLNKINKEIIFLEMDELMRLYHFDFSYKKSLEDARDIFCFQCFTGQRISDIKKINRNDIEKKIVDSVTQYTWHIRPEKVEEEVIHLPLNEFALEILDKHQKLDTPLPQLAEQNLNIAIKEACKKVELKRIVTRTRLYGNVKEVEKEPLHKLVSTHAARRTFITLSLEQGIPVEVVMKYSGHKSYLAMKPYIDITEKRKHIEMNKAWSRDRIPSMQVVQ